jgi:hypothetical protein
MYIGVANYLCLIDESTVRQLMSSEYCANPQIVCDNLSSLADALVLYHHLPLPTTFKNSLLLYFYLIFMIDQL